MRRADRPEEAPLHRVRGREQCCARNRTTSPTGSVAATSDRRRPRTAKARRRPPSRGARGKTGASITTSVTRASLDQSSGRCGSRVLQTNPAREHRVRPVTRPARPARVMPSRHRDRDAGHDDDVQLRRSADGPGTSSSSRYERADAEALARALLRERRPDGDHAMLPRLTPEGHDVGRVVVLEARLRAPRSCETIVACGTTPGRAHRGARRHVEPHLAECRFSGADGTIALGSQRRRSRRARELHPSGASERGHRGRESGRHGVRLHFGRAGL